MSGFVEQDCVIEHQGVKHEAGGAWLLKCTDGYMRGVVYVDEANSDPRFERHQARVTDWHGNIIAVCKLGRVYRGGFGARMQSVRFVYQGVTLSGRYGYDGGNAVRVKGKILTPAGE